MKKYIKTFICTLVLVLLYSINVFAETKELTVEIAADKYSNAVFYISWENIDKTATVEIISPDGTIFNTSKTPDNVYEAEGEAIVRVGQAAGGAWTVKVTGDSLGKIDVSAGQLPNSMIIDSFKVSETGGKYVAEYKVSDCPEEIYVEIFADTDSEGYDGTRIYSGNGGTTGTAELNMNSLESGEYHFYIRISKDGIFKREYSDSIFSYQNPNATNEVKNVAGGKYNNGYYISWDIEDEDVNYKVIVWDGNRNLIKEEEVHGTGIYYGDFGTGESKVYLAVVYKHGHSKYEKVEVLKDTEVEATVEYDVADTITSQKFITAEVTLKSKATFEAYINGEIKIEGENESGKYKVNMSDGDNEVVFLVTDSKGNKQEFVKEIHVDTVAPALAVSEDINNIISTEDHIYISGYSEAGATLLLNDKEIDMKKGYFNEKIELDLGENDVKLVAIDAAGNEAVYTATVKYELSKSSRTELYVVTILIVALSILYIVIFVKGIKRKKK